jgi:ABC-type uncharacterized transport system substrate-binding protein
LGYAVQYTVLNAGQDKYLELGKVAAAIVHRHQQGTNLREIPVPAAKQPQLLINKTTRKALNVNLPEAILKQAVIVE